MNPIKNPEPMPKSREPAQLQASKDGSTINCQTNEGWSLKKPKRGGEKVKKK